MASSINIKSASTSTLGEDQGLETALKNVSISKEARDSVATVGEVAAEIASEAAKAAEPLLGTIKTHSLNHVSRETLDVEGMTKFYKEVLGFVDILRPPIKECKGAWLAIPNAFYNPEATATAIHPPYGTVSLHLIEKDMRFRPLESPLEKKKDEGWEENCDFPNRPAAVRRSHHLALMTEDLDAAEEVLKKRGILYHKDELPGGAVKQLFFYGE
ncbi:hypothetical protein HDU97_002336 [Phlyctochytrium planicorne]|nr:hypothetical protein HDU97_002336 [Phlyctochytrium planicorne]